MPSCRPTTTSAWHTRLDTFKTTTRSCKCRAISSRRGSESRSTQAGTPPTASGRRACGRRRACRWKQRRPGTAPRTQMFKRKQRNKPVKIDNLIGPKTRINGDVEFVGGFHLDGYINGNVVGETGSGAILSVSEEGCIEGSVIAPNVLLNGTVKGSIDAGDRVELGSKARVLGNVHYAVIET